MDTREKIEFMRLRMLDEVQDIAIILLDTDGTILTWNKGVERIKGYKEDEIVGQNFRIFYLPRDRQQGLPERLIELAKAEGRASHIGQRVRKDGSVFWGSITISAIHDEHDKVIGFTKLTRELKDSELS